MNTETIGAGHAQKIITNLKAAPTRTLSGQLFGKPADFKICITGHNGTVAAHYKSKLAGGYTQAEASARSLSHFDNFGLRVVFGAASEIILCDAELTLETNIRALVEAFGAVFLANARTAPIKNDVLQKNIFSGLAFHVDRAPTQPNQYSVYTRDPRDPAQKMPRRTSTLFAPRRTIYLQGIADGFDPAKLTGSAKLDLFGDDNMADVLNKVVLEQSWKAPEGTGEIGIIDNRTLMHASYHPGEKDYQIGTRYFF
ncbi:MAG: hypothetical protein HQ503_12700 [Rhodospirillales bacterium]|nr:hypothetical protein [Rhodospirillales bacterium]